MLEVKTLFTLVDAVLHQYNHAPTLRKMGKALNF